MSGTVGKRAIKSIGGDILYEGFAASRRDLIARLVSGSPPASLAGADLSDGDLSGLNLSGVDFTGARLDRADFRGSTLNGTIFADASLRSAKFQGIRGARADFRQSDLSGADFAGANIPCADFTAAKLNRAEFTEANAASAHFSYAHAEHAVFSGAELYNADFSHSRMIECDFSGARLQHRVFQGKKTGDGSRHTVHLPDRTAGAVIIGCRYGTTKGEAGEVRTKATLCETVPAMRFDRNTGNLSSALIAGLSIVGVTAGVEVGGEQVLEHVQHFFHGGAGGWASTVAILGGAYLLKESLIDFGRETIGSGMRAVVRKARECALDMARFGIHRFNLACLIGSRRSLEPIRMALDARKPEAERHGWWSTVKSFFTDVGHVVMCDRRHLALALATMSNRRHYSHPLPNDVVLLRCHGDHGDRRGPCVVSFLADGRSTATWAVGAKEHVTTVYGPDGKLEGCWDPDGRKVAPEDAGLPESHVSHLDAVFEFEAAVLSDHGLDGFSYPRETHIVENGRDGSILVRRKSNHRVDNVAKEGWPALIRMDGTGILARNGSIEGDWAAARAPGMA